MQMTLTHYPKIQSTLHANYCNAANGTNPMTIRRATCYCGQLHLTIEPTIANPICFASPPIMSSLLFFRSG